MNSYDDVFDLDGFGSSADDRVGELYDSADLSDLSVGPDFSGLSGYEDWDAPEAWEEGDRWDEPSYDPYQDDLDLDEFDYSELSPDELEFLRPDLYEEDLDYSADEDDLGFDGGYSDELDSDAYDYEPPYEHQSHAATPYDAYADELEMLDMGLDRDGTPLSPAERLMRQDEIRGEVAREALQHQFFQHVTESKDSFIDYLVGQIPDREIGEHLRWKMQRMDPVSVFHVVNSPEQMENAMLMAEGLAARRSRAFGDYARTGAPNGGDPRAPGGQRLGRSSAEEDFLTMIAQDTGLSEAEARRAARSKLG